MDGTLGNQVNARTTSAPPLNTCVHVRALLRTVCRLRAGQSFVRNFCNFISQNLGGISAQIRNTWVTASSRFHCERNSGGLGATEPGGRSETLALAKCRPLPALIICPAVSARRGSPSVCPVTVLPVPVRSPVFSTKHTHTLSINKLNSRGSLPSCPDRRPCQTVFVICLATRAPT